MTRCPRPLLAACLVTCVVVMSPVTAVPSAQTGTSTWVTPRTPWGDPDLQGVWPGTAMMGVPIERPRQFADRAFLSDDEFSAREAQSRVQSQADGQAVVQAPGPGRGAGTGPPGHWGERGRPQRQSSLVVDPKDGRIPAM